MPNTQQEMSSRPDPECIAKFLYSRQDPTPEYQPLNRILKKTRILLSVLSLIPSIYYYSLQTKEDNIVYEYLNTNSFLNLPHTIESAIKISDKIRSDFNSNESTFSSLNYKNRPFLRESASYLLTHREGLCGEGTRVLVVLLNRLGYDATRLTLYNRILHPSHTLVSLVIDDREYLLDSINSTMEINTFLKENKISTSSFHITNYIDDLAKRKKTNRAMLKEELKDSDDLFFKKYWLYSYEAEPFTKLFSKLGLNIRAFNLDRPAKWISSLAEKPYQIMSYFCLMISVLFISSLYILSFSIPNHFFVKRD